MYWIYVLSICIDKNNSPMINGPGVKRLTCLLLIIPFHFLSPKFYHIPHRWNALVIYIYIYIHSAVTYQGYVIPAGRYYSTNKRLVGGMLTLFSGDVNFLFLRSCGDIYPPSLSKQSLHFMLDSYPFSSLASTCVQLIYTLVVPENHSSPPNKNPILVTYCTSR